MENLVELAKDYRVLLILCVLVIAIVKAFLKASTKSRANTLKSLVEMFQQPPSKVRLKLEIENNKTDKNPEKEKKTRDK